MRRLLAISLLLSACGPSDSFLTAGPDRIEARGRWQADAGPDLAIGGQENTVRLTCDRKAGECVEERTVEGHVYEIRYAIRAWTESEVAAALNGPAAVGEVFVDLKAQQVRLTRQDRARPRRPAPAPVQAHLERL